MHSRSGEFIEVLPAWKLIGFNWPWVIADGLTPDMPAGRVTLMTGKSPLKSAVVSPRTNAATPSTEFEPYGLSAPDSALES